MCDTYEDATEMSSLLTEVVSCKKAAIVAMFFLYLVYLVITGATYLMEYKKNDDALKKLKAVKLDIE